MTKKSPDLTKRTLVDVTIEGVPVRVCLDGDGRPLYAQGGFGEVDERLVGLAVKHAFDAYLRKAKATKRKRDSDKAADKSRKNRAKASAAHWTNKWFSLAYADHPTYGKDKLAQRARSLAAMEDDKAQEGQKAR